jgi:hypothetical protein
MGGCQAIGNGAEIARVEGGRQRAGTAIEDIGRRVDGGSSAASDAQPFRLPPVGGGIVGAGTGLGREPAGRT